MKRVFAVLLSICLLASLAAPALAAPIKTSGAASTLKLESVDGTAKLNNASGKEVKTTKGARLYNGYKLATEKASYAYVSLDDAKAIKSITRSGTTFTYTCMDGTTGTFTQQDNNTTYSAATTSADGLMSAADKTKLNNIALTVNSDGVLMLSV